VAESIPSETEEPHHFIPTPFPQAPWIQKPPSAEAQQGVEPRTGGVDVVSTKALRRSTFPPSGVLARKR